MSNQQTLDLESQESAPVECLGQTFPSDEARREHYLELLAEKLEDPEFREIEGFPIGEDENILAMSDPPYYTACPNPWIGEFIEHYGRPYDPKDEYHREPFAADVSEGKNHQIYNAHSYHTKVPHRAIMRYLLHYTEPGDVVYDGFCGTGMTGVAAQLCGDRKEIQELGYRVDPKGDVFDESGNRVSRTGARRSIINDLSPAATFIASNYNLPVDGEQFENAAQRILNQLKEEIGWMYETRHTDGSVRTIDYTVWSEVYTCPECGGEINFLEEAFDKETKKVREEFSCPHCSASLTKRRLERVFESSVDPKLGGVWKRVKFRPCLIQYRVGKQKHEKVPDEHDLEVLRRIGEMDWPESIPSNEWPIDKMYHGSRIDPKGFNHTHQFFMARPAMALARLWELSKEHPDARVASLLLFFVEQAIWGLSRMNRYSPSHFSQVNRMLSGVYYIAAQHSECSPWYNLGGKLSRLLKVFQEHWGRAGFSIVSTESAGSIDLGKNSLDYVFTDPPFGENIPYADLNLVLESWHKVRTATDTEAIIDKPKGKELAEYQQLMLQCFHLYYRALKPGRWITVEFSNSQASVWNAIQATLQEAGFVVANVAALDKKQRSFRSVTSPTAVKQDLVISAYKPSGDLEERFEKAGHTVAGCLDFLKTHLNNLPVVKARGGELEFIAERDPRILYDRMVAFYVGHGVPVPLSSAEFQAEVAEKFPERDGMAFLPDQVAEYDKKRAQMQGVGQMSIFIEDEKSAIDWLRGFLKQRPSVYADVQPKYFDAAKEVSWKKWEMECDLQRLLDENFLQYHGDGDVPSQIHSYLSTQNKDLRKLPKDDARLKNRAKDRWYVPDPAKAVDVESLRNKRLLQEFWDLCDQAGINRPAGDANQPTLPNISPPTKKTGTKKLKEVRTEAVRLGFKECFAAKDYATILALASHLPANVIEEDENLQMTYDLAEMRAEG
ncbi:MAG: DNA methyltransferase [Verrucomicrobiales bacterium]